MANQFNSWGNVCSGKQWWAVASTLNSVHSFRVELKLLCYKYFTSQPNLAFPCIDKYYVISAGVGVERHSLYAI